MEDDSFRVNLEAELAEATRMRTELEVKLENIKEEMELSNERMEREKDAVKKELEKTKEGQEILKEEQEVDKFHSKLLTSLFNILQCYVDSYKDKDQNGFLLCFSWQYSFYIISFRSLLFLAFLFYFLNLENMFLIYNLFGV